MEKHNVKQPYGSFLDNREATGAAGAPTSAATRSSMNKKRAMRIQWLRRQNLGFAAALEDRLRDFTSTAREWGGVEAGNEVAASHPKVTKLIGNLRGCSSASMFREFAADGALSYIGSHTCKNRLCMVCNSERKRRVRSRYYRYFEERPQLLEEYDAMHLTLTVPHGRQGWRGEKVYLKPLGEAFHKLRKMAFWKERVYAGEMTVEFTSGPNGLHIHIHAILLVHRAADSRNALHREILREWNGLTVDPDAARQGFTMDQRWAIRRSLGYMGDGAASDLIDVLDPRGSTLVGLRSLYVTSETDRKGYKYDANLGRWIRYCKAGDPNDMAAGIMEGLKYHFEPLALKTPEGDWNADLVIRLAPVLHGQRLYRKLGAWHGVKELNLADASQADEVEEMLAEASEVVVHPETGEIAEREEYQYVAADVAVARIDHLGRLRIGGKRRPIEHRNIRDALAALVAGQIAKIVNAKNKLRHGKARDYG